MREYIISKLINNNIVFSTDEKGNEIILFGKAIGFAKKKGDVVKSDQVIRSFKATNNNVLNYLTNLVEDINPVYIDLSNKIIEKFENELHVKVNDIMAISLSDHLSNAINNKRNGIDVPLSITNQISLIYPHEYKIAKESLNLIYSETGVMLSDYEAGYIVLHYLNSQDKEYREDAKYRLNFEEKMVGVVEKYYNVVFDKESFYFRRFLTHLSFLAARVHDNIRIDDHDDTVYEVLTNKYKDLKECIELCSKEIRNEFNIEIGVAEKGFLAIHIINMLKAMKKEEYYECNN